jgi:hypothetical protein
VLHARIFNKLNFFGYRVDSLPSLIKDQRDARWDGDIAEEVVVKANFAGTAEILDQGTDDGTTHFAHLADGMAEAKHVAVDPVAQTTPLSNQLGALNRQHAQFLDWTGGDPRFTPKPVKTVLGQLSGIKAIRLSPYVAGVGRIDYGYASFPSQAKWHVVLTCGLASVTKIAKRNLDAVRLQSSRNP